MKKLISKRPDGTVKAKINYSDVVSATHAKRQYIDVHDQVMRDRRDRESYRNYTKVSKVIWSHVGFGYGDSLTYVSHETAFWLQRHGIDVKALLWSDGAAQKWNPKRSLGLNLELATDEDIANSAVIVLNRGVPPPHIFDRIRRCKAPFVASYYMLEGTMARPPEVDRLNAFDAVFTPSEFCKKSMIDSGVSVPVHVWGHGFNPSVYPFMEPQKNRPFTFLYLGTEDVRKGNGAFLQAFSMLDIPNIRAWYHVPAISEETRRKYKDDHRIVWDASKIHPYMMKYLMAESDVIVCPFRAEGFLLPMLEAMASGRPAIATQFSGPLDFGGSHDMTYWVPVKGWEPSKYDAGVWAVPDISDLTAAMQWCAEHPDEVREKGAAASREAYKSWTWERKVLEVIPVLKGMIPNFDIAI